MPQEHEVDDQNEWDESDDDLLIPMRRGKVVVRKFGDENLSPSIREEMEKYGAQSIMYVPFRVRRDFIGYAEMWESRYARDFTEEEINLCVNMSTQAAFALQRTHLFEEISQAREAAEAANVAKSEFISVVAHELKGPMTSIKGFAEMLAVGSMGAVNESQHEYLEIIQNTVDRMALLVSDLTDISRIEAGNLKIKLKDVDITEIINTVVRDNQQSLLSKRQNFEQDLLANLPKVIADPQPAGPDFGQTWLATRINIRPKGGR